MGVESEKASTDGERAIVEALELHHAVRGEGILRRAGRLRRRGPVIQRLATFRSFGLSYRTQRG